MTEGHCGKGICLAMEGRDGSCAEASGWAEPVAEDTLCGICGEPWPICRVSCGRWSQ